MRRPRKELDVHESNAGLVDPSLERTATLVLPLGSTLQLRMGGSLQLRMGGLLKSARERAEEKREAKLETVREQVQSGSLTIRQMTDEERRRFPPRPPGAKRSGRR